MRICEEQDEIKQFLNAQHVGASKVVWCLLKMSMHGKDPNVVCFHLYLPGMH
jgi:hypothetical protein